jgi:UDP-N-acetylmuramyl tripeptide synthase
VNGRPLSELVLALRSEGLVAQGPTSSVNLSGLTADSRSVASGDAFIAVRGSQSDGHQFVADAVKRGAAALVVEQPMGSGVPEIVVVDARRAAIAAGRFWYGDPARKLCLIGVTGTNGKTTTTALVRHLLMARARRGASGPWAPSMAWAIRSTPPLVHSPHRGRSICRRRWPSWSHAG